MSEPLVRERPSIDLDDFERRLRQEDNHHEDPLAQLARLVGEHPDPYGDVFAEETRTHPAQTHYAQTARREPAFDVSSPRIAGNFAAIEAGLRGALAAHPETAPHGEADSHEFYAQDERYAQGEVAYLQDHEADQWAAAPQPRVTRSSSGKGRRPIYAMVATIAVGVIGIGVAFAYKGTGSSPREIKTIAALSGPTKIQPPADASKDQGAQDSAVLSKEGHEAPTQLVSREEQPVDLSQAVQDSASRNADTGSNSQGDASSVPVPLSPNQARSAPPTAEASSTDALAAFGVGMPAPKKVKVVSVRPDGTILQNDAPPAAAFPRTASLKTNDQGEPVAKASTPKTASTKTTAKSTSRVAATPKASKVADDNSDAGDATTKPAHKAKPQRVASTEPTGGADDTTASLGSKSGGFAVQVAAPGSEADARSASSRLSKKYASALSGRHLGFHKAQSNGKSVYRVRVSSLTKDEAVSLCEKLKSNGGSCFVAKSN